MFNVCDYERKVNVAIPNVDVDLDALVAGISLPVFSPAVRRHGKLYTDSVWIKDTNVAEAVRRGAGHFGPTRSGWPSSAGPIRCFFFFVLLFFFFFLFTVFDITLVLGIQIDPNQFLKFCKIQGFVLNKSEQSFEPK
jgi:hypothetical protein